MKDDLHKQLFKRTDINDVPFSELLERTGMSNSINMFSKTYLLRFICALIARLSLVISVWVFLFNHELWYGIPMFALLSAILGGIEDRNMPVPK